jgi:hypothetical protein
MTPFSFWSALTKDNAASTFIRLAKSHHVADLQLIFWVSCILMLAGSIFVIIWHGWMDSSGVIGSTALISGIVGVGFGVLAWAYQTGSARLGIVDLFACEITTICRVITIAETAPRYVQLYSDPPSVPMNFNSHENYSPVFDQNSKDLEVLEARVVGRVTEFYTYLKTLRDYLRLVGTIVQPQDERERWSTGMRNAMYMLFLMLESARKSVDRLIEYEPECAQNTIEILLSELVLYSFLLKVFEAHEQEHLGYNAHAERLRLRKDDYATLAHTIYARALSKRDRGSWQKTIALLKELDHRYHDAFGEWLNASHPSSATSSRIPARLETSASLGMKSADTTLQAIFP